MPNLLLRIAYWVAVTALAYPFAQGIAQMLGVPIGFGLLVFIPLCWHPLGLLIFVPSVMQGLSAVHQWGWFPAMAVALIPLLPILALDDWRAFKPTPDLTRRGGTPPPPL